MPDALKGADVQNGAMIAFFLPVDVAQTLSDATSAAGIALPEPVDQSHLTLLYLGKVDALGTAHETILDAIRSALHGLAPLTGTINGIGRFTHDSDGCNAVYASFDSPALPAFRQCLVEAISALGLPLPNEHGFTPHITLAYIPSDAPMPDIRLPRLSVTFEAVTLAWGGERQTVLLGGSVPNVPDQPSFTGETMEEGNDSAIPASGVQPMKGATEPREQFADYAHTAWAGWMRHLFQFGKQNTDGTFTINADKVERWQRQMKTPYTALPDEEKESDRAEADHILAITSSIKAVNYSARAGEVITGNLARSATGQFASAGNPQEPKPKTPQQRAGESRRAKSEAARQDNRSTVSSAVGSGSSGVSSAAVGGLLTFADGGALDADAAETLARVGLVEYGVDGEPRMTPAGRQAVNAMNRGDVRGTLDSISKGKERALRKAEAEARKATRALQMEQRKKDRQAARDEKARLSAQQKKEREAERARKTKEREQAKAKREQEREQLKAQRLAEREQKRKEREQAKATRDTERAKAKEQRDTERAKAKEQRDSERAKAKEQRDQERQRKADERAKAKAEREAAAAQRKKEREQAKAARTAEQTRKAASREAAKKEREQANARKKAERQAALQAAMEAAMGAVGASASTQSTATETTTRASTTPTTMPTPTKPTRQPAVTPAR